MTWFSSPGRRACRPRCRPAVEALETRLAPAVAKPDVLTCPYPNLGRTSLPAAAAVPVVASGAPRTQGGMTGTDHSGGGVAPAEKLVLQRGPFQLDPLTQVLVQQVSVRNEGFGTLHGPLTLVLDGLPPGVRLRKGNSIEVTHTAHGARYRLASVARLRPGQSVSVLLGFVAPGQTTVPYRLRLL